MPEPAAVLPAFAQQADDVLDLQVRESEGARGMRANRPPRLLLARLAPPLRLPLLLLTGSLLVQLHTARGWADVAFAQVDASALARQAGERIAEADFEAAKLALKAAETGPAFTDLVFTPGPESLCYDWAAAAQQGSGVDVPLWRRLLWNSPSAFSISADGAPPTLFDASGRAASPSDVVQGALGDCYFLSALSALAEDDAAVEALFPAHAPLQPRSSARARPSSSAELSPELCLQRGIHVVRLCVQGHWRLCVVDDTIPCTPPEDGGRPAFSRAAGGELWPLLLEKAYAKSHGSYQAVVEGLAGEALSTLTGAPCDYVLAESAECWGRVAQALQPGRDWFCVAVLPHGAGRASLEGTGLVPNHAYSVLDVAEIRVDAEGTVARLFKLRNPWGEEGAAYFGPFGREPGGETDASGELQLSCYWTVTAREEMAKLGKPLSFSDGCFWMDEATSFRSFFAGVSICRATPGHSHASEDVWVQNGRTEVLLLTAATDCECDLSVLQKDARTHLAGGAAGPGSFDRAGFSYLGARLCVVKADTMELVASMGFVKQRDVWTEVAELKAGSYYVLLQTDWDGSARPDASPYGAEATLRCPLVVTARSSSPVTLRFPHHVPRELHIKLFPSCGSEILRAALAVAACAPRSEPADEGDVCYGDLFASEECRELRSYEITKSVVRAGGGSLVAWLYRNNSHRLLLTETLPFVLDNVEVGLWSLKAGVKGAQLPIPTQEEEEAEERPGCVVVRLAPGEAKLLVLSAARAGPFTWALAPGAASASLEEIKMPRV